jgi:microcystin-dependent protein
MPAHTHQARGVSTTATAPSPSGNTWADSVDNPYSTNANIGSVAMNAASVSPVGGSQPHDNMQPYLVMNYVIAMQGIFPSRN